MLLDTLSPEDIAVLEAFQEDEDGLYAIMQCQDFAALKKKFPPRYKGLKKVGQALHAKSSLANRLRFKTIDESLLNLINPVTAVALIIDALFTLTASLSLASIVAATGGFGILFGVVGVVSFIGTYRGIEATEKEERKEEELLLLKKACAELYLAKHPEVQKPQQAVPPPKTADKNRWQKASDSLGTLMLVSSTLFYTYYALTLAISVAFAGSALAVALTGPIGLGVALAVAFGVGLYFGYKRYQVYKENDRLQLERKNLTADYEIEFNLCAGVQRKKEHQLSPKPSPPASPKQQHRIDSLKGGPIFLGSPVTNPEDTSTHAHGITYTHVKNQSF